MSLSRRTDNEFISPETFLSNQAKIEQARKLLEEMENKNRQGLQKFTEREKQQREAEQELLLKQKEELQKKIQEGLQAQRYLEELDKRQSTLSTEHISAETASVGSARIEEIHPDSSQLPLASEALVSRNNSYILPVQNQFPQRSEYRSTQILPTQVQSYSSTIAVPNHIPATYRPYTSGQILPTVQHVQHQSAYTAPSQKAYNNQGFVSYHPGTSATSWHPSQTPNKFTNVNSTSSSHTSTPLTFVNNTPLHSSEFHQPNDTISYGQRPLSKSNKSEEHVDISTQNVSKQMQGHVYTGPSGTISSVSNDTLQPDEPPQQRFVDDYGVPFFPFTDEQVFAMEKSVRNWDRRAPAGMVDKLNELIFLQKDTSQKPTTWIYVPKAPGSRSFSRTSDIDRFFTILLENSRQARTGPVPPVAPVALAKSTAPGNESASRANVASEAPGVQQVDTSQSSSLSTSMNIESSGLANPVIKTPGSSTPQVAGRPISLATPAKSSNTSSITPHPSARKFPLSSAIDKKRLSQNVLYALGKRTRPNDHTASEGQPGKKVATSPSVISQSAGMIAPVVAPTQTALTTTSKDHVPSSSSPVPTVSIGFSSPVAQSNLNVASGSMQRASAAPNLHKPSNAVGPLTADAILLENVQQNTFPKSGSLQSNPYAPLLSFTPNNLLGPASQISAIKPTQHAKQHLQAQTYPIASSSSHVADHSNSDFPPRYDGKDISKAKEPLFLPSSSPERIPESVISKSEKGSTRSSLWKGKIKARQEMFVLVPPPPDYLVRLRQQKTSKALEQSDTETARKQFQLLKTGASSVPSSVVGDEVAESEPQSDIENFERERQAAIELSCTRLQPVPCKWDGCNIILNSYKALNQHLNSHKPSRSVNRGHFICRWTSCGKMCNFDGAHLSTHSVSTMYCAYEGCRSSFRSASQLLKHHISAHKQSDELRPSAGLLEPVVDSVPDIPSSLPAYSLFTRMVQPASVTPERHEVICPWVIRTVINSDQEKRTKFRTKKTAKAPSRPIPTIGNEYEFIRTRSTRYSSYLSQAVDLPMKDLEPTVISQMIDEGLVLWPSEDVNISEEPIHDSPIPGPVEPRTQTSGIVKEEMDDGPVHQVDNSSGALHRPEHSSDEEAVTALLTVG